MFFNVKVKSKATQIHIIQAEVSSIELIYFVPVASVLFEICIVVLFMELHPVL